MPADAPKRFNIWTPLIFSFLLVLGIIIGFQLNKYLGYKRPITAIIERNDRLEEIIDIIQAKYVDTVSADSLYEDAVSGILKHLDPHTIYIPAREMAAVTEGLEGNFKGIGVEFYILHDTIMFTAVIPNGPSDDAGIKTGDKLILLNDSLVAGVGITNEGIIKLLRGLEGTSVRLGLIPPSGHQVKEVKVKRGLVPLYSVDARYMLDKETGYIRINRFSATTYREFMQALDTLLQQGLQQLVLDLRQNPGGYLDAAIAITDEIIGGDKLLVYTQGRTAEKEEFKATKKGKFEQGRIAVLVDEGSASASEIIAGAIQDWDRGVVIGRRTFGKGLVQEQFELEDGSALRLTVSRYYTPVGRSIQRPYHKGKEVYNHDYLDRLTNGSLTRADTSSPKDTTRYYTGEKHRTVFGGGGIFPDIVIPYETILYSKELYTLLNSSILNNNVYDYYAQHSVSLSQFKTFQQFSADFKATSLLMDMLRKRYEQEYPEVAKKVWQNPESVGYLRSRTKALLAKMLFHNNGYYMQINLEDKTVQRAKGILNSAEYSIIMKGQGG